MLLSSRAIMKDETRVMSAWNATVIRSYIMSTSSPNSFGSAVGVPATDVEAWRSIFSMRVSISRTFCR